MSEIQSLARGLKILEILAAAPDGAGITELADRLGVDKGSASRLTGTLAKYGYAEKNPSTRRYHLGPQIVTLGQRLLAQRPFREEARPFLRELVEATDECAHLAVSAQGQAFYVEQVESAATLRVNAAVGTLAPLHCTALGKVLLAFGDAPVPPELPSHTPRTITDREMLQAHLERVRRQGYAVDDEEYDYGVRCIAAPVYDLNDHVVAAIGISGPSHRMSLERIPELADQVVKISQGLSNRLSFRPR